MLFRSAWQTLDSFGWDRKQLGAQIGATMVLHTWSSNLSYHPHLHAIVPGGGVTWHGKWKAVKGNGKYLFAVKAMSKVYRGKFIGSLKKWMCQQGMNESDKLIRSLYKNEWVVYAKPPFGGRGGVIRYLARYTHKLAITHHRIITYDADKVTFCYTDYRHGNQTKTMTLSVWEFIRRYMLHFLPKGFSRIRHYGILSSAWKQRVFSTATKKAKVDWQQIWQSKGLNVNQCPDCKIGHLICIGTLDPLRGPPYHHHAKTQKV